MDAPAQEPVLPSALDNFAACICHNTWIIFGGFFGGSIGLHSNYVFIYDFDTNHWAKHANEVAPTPRDGSDMACYKGRLFIFGGNNGQERFNDLWSFNLDKLKWDYIKLQGTVLPKVRSGHILERIDNHLILFAGIHDITWEMDDLFLFDLEKNVWLTIDEDSSRKKDHKEVQSQESSPERKTRSFKKVANKVKLARKFQTPSHRNPSPQSTAELKSIDEKRVSPSVPHLLEERVPPSQAEHAQNLYS